MALFILLFCAVEIAAVAFLEYELFKLWVFLVGRGKENERK